MTLGAQNGLCIYILLAGTFDMNLTRNPLSSKHTHTHPHANTYACKPLSLSVFFILHLFFSLSFFLSFHPVSLPSVLACHSHFVLYLLHLAHCLHFQNSLSLSSCQCPFPSPPFIRGIPHDSKVIPCNDNIVLIDVIIRYSGSRIQ